MRFEIERKFLVSSRACINQPAAAQGLMQAEGRRRKQVGEPVHSEQTAMQVGVCPREAPTGCPQEALRGSRVHLTQVEAADLQVRPEGPSIAFVDGNMLPVAG